MLKIPEKIEKILDILCQNGFEAYIVGGCVRDMLMGKAPNDYDVTTSAKPEDIMRIFEKTVPTGIKHGTVTVISDGLPVEVTTYRTETDYTDHRRPDKIEFVTSLKQDLARRDFTVNAMAYNKQNGLQDFFGGKQDLESKILRAVGDAKIRFNEDALRILRLFRFAATLGFECEKNTLRAAIEYSYLLENMSRERILAELSKAVMGDNLKAFSPLVESNALSFLEIKKSLDYEQISKLEKKSELRLTAFLHSTSTNAVETLKLLKASNYQIDYADKFTRLLTYMDTKERFEIKVMLSLSGKEILLDYFGFLECKGCDMSLQIKVLKEVLENNEPYLLSHLKISGNTLIKMGYEGSRIGEILNKLLILVLRNPDLNNEKDLISEISRL